jgi:excisionase family DNA binding protein
MSTVPRRKLAPLDTAQRYSVEEASSYLRTSRQSVFKKIAAGELRTIKDGRRTYIPGAEIARLSA